MATYITVADVDAILGASWAPDDKKARAVLQANAYLTSLNLVGIDMDAIPEEVKQAGAELAAVPAAHRGIAGSQDGEGWIGDHQQDVRFDRHQQIHCAARWGPVRAGAARAMACQRLQLQRVQVTYGPT